jgi:protein-disulfide isomerase
VEPQLEEQYVKTGKIRFVYQHFAFIGGPNGESVHAAEASECANDQGKFWEYHDLLFANQGGENTGAFSDANLKRFAVQSGVPDIATFNTCYDNRSRRGIVSDSNGQAAALGINSTPTVFVIGIDGKRVTVANSTDFNSVKAVVDNALAQAGVR